MVLDPMTALSLAGNIVQFVDFSSKIVSKGRRLYLSAEGALPKNLELEVVTNDLSRLAERLGDDGVNTAGLSDDENSLQVMSNDCSKIAEVLLGRLEKLKVKSDAKHRGWKSLRQALKSVWSKEELDELFNRLLLFRDQLQFRILISMKEGMDLRALKQSERFNILDQAAKSLLTSLLNNGIIFTSQINSQTITITDLHLETRALIKKEAKKTRTEILTTLKASEFVGNGYKPNQYDLSSYYVANSWKEHFRIQDIILQSLQFSTLKNRYDAIKEAHTKTFEWIFQKHDDIDTPWDDFSDWLRHGDGIYWISGKAGSGKSTLMRYLQDDPRLLPLLQSWTAQGEDLVIATFFFWISGVSDQASQVGLLRSLLFELLSSKPHLIEATLPDLWSSLRSSAIPLHYSQSYNWTLARVTSCFKRLFSMISQDIGYVFLLIDGLDECEGNPAETIRLLQSVISPNVKICVSSRPWQVFEVAFKKAPKLRLQDLTFEDIKRYVNDKLHSNEQMEKLCAVDPVGAPRLIEEIVEKAEGVFLWVTLVIESFLTGLTNGDSISYFRKRIEEIPSELEDLYSYMLSQIRPLYYEEGRRLFSIVRLAFHKEKQYEGNGICAFRLYSAIRDDEDFTAPCQRPNKEKVIGMVELVDTRLKVCCAGLLEISSPHHRTFEGNLICLSNSGNRPIQYIHRTARDFLSGGGSQKTPEWICPVIVDKIPFRVMRANVMYLKSRLWQGDGMELMGLSNYIKVMIKKTMWLARTAEREAFHHNAEILDAFEESVTQLFDYSIEWGALVWRESGDAINRSNWFDDFLCVAIVWNLDLFLEKKLRQGKNVLQAKRGRPYLDYALRYLDDRSRPEDQWDLKTISILLEHGGNPNLHYSVGTVIDQNRFLTQSTPWESVLFTVDKYIRKGNDDGFSSHLAPLLELMIIHGADLHATSVPGQLSGYSVANIVSQYSVFSSFPEKYKRLRKLTGEPKIKQSPGSAYRSLKKASFTSRLKSRLKSRK